MGKVTTEEFIKKLEKVNENIIITGEYVASQVKIGCYCKICDFEWEAKPNHLLSGRGCPNCYKINRSKSQIYPYEEFKKKAQRNSPNVELLGEYTGLKFSIPCRCKICGHEWVSNARNIALGHASCPNCSGRKKRTTEEFIKELKTINSSIIVLGDYISNAKKIKCKCKLCGNEWNSVPARLLAGQGCPMCAHSGTSYVEQFIYKAFVEALGAENVCGRNKDIIGKELDIYIPMLKIAIEPGAWEIHKRKLDVDQLKMELCRQKGIDLYVIYFFCKDEMMENAPNVLYYAEDLANVACQKQMRELIYYLFARNRIDRRFTDSEWNDISNYAYEKSRKMTTEEFAQKVYDVNPDVRIIGKYKGITVKIKCQCPKCQWIWNANPRNILRGSRCPKCYGTSLKTQDQFVEELKQLNSNIQVLGKYEGAHKKIECKCCLCGNVWDAEPNCLLSKKNSCPVCSNKKVMRGYNDLATVKPSLVEEWDYEANNGLNPTEVVAGSNKKAWWKCHLGHKWSAAIYRRCNGSGCPYCSNKVVLTGYNDLQTLNPELSLEWHPTKNQDLKPTQITAGSNKKVWWLGKCGHQWEARIYARNKGAGCPYCRNGSVTANG